MGGHNKINWTFAHKNWYFKATIFYSSLKNETYKPGSDYSLVSYAARTIAWKISQQERMPPVAQTGFCLERGGLNQKWMFFAQKLSNLGPVLNKPMQLKRVTEGAEPPAAGWFLAIFWQK